MNIRKHIPNTITCLSLVSGCIATVMALQDNYLWAAIWIIIAAVFDFSRRLCRPFAEGLFSDGKRVGLIVGYGEFRSGTRYDRILDAGTGKPPF